MDTAPATWDEFKGDLGASVRAWRVAPLLPLASIAFFLATYLPEPWWQVTLPLGVFAIGWFGTERIWYLRIYRGETIVARELWRLTWAFFGRFLCLGLVAGIVWSPVVILAGTTGTTGSDPARHDEVFSSPSVLLMMALLTLVIDFGLTFVTPALAFSTRKVSEAFGIGFRMLRAHWPRTAWYALVPPLAVVLMFRATAPGSLGTAGMIAATTASGLLNLCFKGATVAFYLRRVETGSDGAAFAPKEEVDAPARG